MPHIGGHNWKNEEVKTNLGDIPDFYPDRKFVPQESYEEYRKRIGDPVKELSVDEELTENDVMAIAKNHPLSKFYH